jgi:hypothetical protein
VLDRAVLAGRVHRLENDEECESVARPEELLCVRELLDSLCENRPRLGLELLFRQVLVAGEGGPCGVAVGERGAGSRLDDEMREYPFVRGDRCLLRLGGHSAGQRCPVDHDALPACRVSQAR